MMINSIWFIMKTTQNLHQKPIKSHRKVHEKRSAEWWKKFVKLSTGKVPPAGIKEIIVKPPEFWRENFSNLNINSQPFFLQLWVLLFRYHHPSSLFRWNSFVTRLPTESNLHFYIATLLRGQSRHPTAKTIKKFHQRFDNFPAFSNIMWQTRRQTLSTPGKLLSFVGGDALGCSRRTINHNFCVAFFLLLLTEERINDT